MALIMKTTEGQVTFFIQVFGATDVVTLKAKALAAAGVKFDVLLYGLTATWQGNFSQVDLTVGSNSVMKATASPAVLDQNKKLVEEWIGKLIAELGVQAEAMTPNQGVTGPMKLILVSVDAAMSILPVIKAVRTLTGMSLVEAKEFVESVKLYGAATVANYPTFYAASKAEAVLKAAGGVTKVETGVSAVPVGQAIPVAAVKEWAAAVKPVAGVIDLKQAKALGQKVHGTSNGSVYHTIAIGESVRIAARLNKGGAVSIRAEWPAGSSESELKKLQEAGVQMKGGYGSIHFDADGVPLQRVIGAFLMGTGINWKAVVTNGADLVIGDI